jgi:hypothetical protein
MTGPAQGWGPAGRPSCAARSPRVTFNSGLRLGIVLTNINFVGPADLLASFAPFIVFISSNRAMQGCAATIFNLVTSVGFHRRELPYLFCVDLKVHDSKFIVRIHCSKFYFQDVDLKVY